jgi:hypothetical protein
MYLLILIVLFSHRFSSFFLMFHQLNKMVLFFNRLYYVYAMIDHEKIKQDHTKQNSPLSLSLPLDSHSR